MTRLVQSIELGREAFENRRLSRKEYRACGIAILQRYQLKLQEYGISTHEDVRVVATTAVREASNRLAFTDRIFVATGLNVDSIDEAEVNRITYMGVIPHLMSDTNDLADGKSLVVEVGGGNTEVLLMRSGNVLHSHSYRLGSLRLLHTLEGRRAPIAVAATRDHGEPHSPHLECGLTDEIQDDNPVQLIALGGDIRFAARQLLEQWDESTLAELSTEPPQPVNRQKCWQLDDRWDRQTLRTQFCRCRNPRVPPCWHTRC